MTYQTQTTDELQELKNNLQKQMSDISNELYRREQEEQEKATAFLSQSDALKAKLTELLGEEGATASLDTIRGLLAYDLGDLDGFTSVAIAKLAETQEETLKVLLGVLQLLERQ